MYRVIKDIITDRKTTELESGFIWQYLKSNLQGEDIPNRPLSYETSEFGEISRKEITQTFEHVFGAKIKKVNGIRMLSFDLAKLERLGRVYDLDMQIKVIREEECSSKEYGADRSLRADVGIDRHLNEPDNGASYDNPERESKGESVSNNNENDLVDPVHPPNPPYPTLASDMTNEEQRAAYEEAQAKALRRSREAQGEV